MYPLFESIKVVDGEIFHIDWHQKRFLKSYKALYNKTPLSELICHIKVPLKYKTGVFKLKISYNEYCKKIEFTPYSISKINAVQVIIDNSINYEFKYSDRNKLIEAHKQKGACDDILIIKEGMVTDSSYSNIVFYNGHKWITPSSPLLKGTARERLLEEGVIDEQPIKLEDIPLFKSFKLINALRDFNEVETLDITCIKL